MHIIVVIVSIAVIVVITIRIWNGAWMRGLGLWRRRKEFGGAQQETGTLKQLHQ